MRAASFVVVACAVSACEIAYPTSDLAGVPPDATNPGDSNVDASTDTGPASDTGPNGDSGAAVGHLFVIGGSSGSLGQHAVLGAAIFADGTIDGWSTVSTLPVDATANALAYDGAHLFVVGKDFLGSTTTTRFTTLDASGSLGNWGTDPSLPPLVKLGAAAAHGHVYAIGGEDDATPTKRHAEVYASTIGSDGSPSTWATSTALPAARASHATATIGDHLYVLGGVDDAGNGVASILLATIGSDGSLSAWDTSSRALPAAWIGSSALVVGEYLYVLGGYGNLNGVSYAHVDTSTGAIGAWITAPSMNDEHAYFAAAAPGGAFLCAVGGFDHTEANGATAECAKLGSGGAPGAWSHVASIPAGRVFVVGVGSP